MKNIHIRFEYKEALEGKKEFISSQVNTLELLKNFKDYRTHRRRELILKTKLKNELNHLNEGVKKLGEDLPKEEEEEAEVEQLKKAAEKEHKKSKMKKTGKAGKKQPEKRESKEEKEERNLGEELREIQEKLARLE
jgi:hypothetical protein